MHIGQAQAKASDTLSHYVEFLYIYKNANIIIIHQYTLYQ